MSSGRRVGRKPFATYTYRARSPAPLPFAARRFPAPRASARRAIQPPGNQGVGAPPAFLVTVDQDTAELTSIGEIEGFTRVRGLAYDPSSDALYGVGQALVGEEPVDSVLLPGYEPPECTGLFDDVACPSLFADWIEELANRDITAGCDDDNYCPGASVSRAQMATFIAKTFGLTLYGP